MKHIFKLFLLCLTFLLSCTDEPSTLSQTASQRLSPAKYLIENAIMEFAKKQEQETKPFQIKTFLDQFNAIGNIPVVLAQWQMTEKYPF